MPSEPDTGQQAYHATTLAPATAVKVLGASILTIYAVQIGLYNLGIRTASDPAAGPFIALSVAAAGFATVLIGLVVWRRRQGWTATQLGLKRPAAVFLVAAVLVGISAWYVNGWIVTKLDPRGDPSELQAIVEQTPLVSTVLALALLPAIIEELVFRGVFARAMATTFGAIHAVGFSAAIFALYHLLPPQMVSTLCLGIVLGYLTLRASSAIPAMLAHLINNTVTLVVSRNEVPGLTPWMEGHAGVMLVGTSVVLASGIALAVRGAA